MHEGSTPVSIASGRLAARGWRRGPSTPRSSAPGGRFLPRGEKGIGGWFAAAAAALALAGAAHAVLPDEQLANPKLEARARRLGSELRCLVCQNQTIDDSDAPLAADIRVLLRQRLLAGDSDRQAVDYIVERYGHYVLLKPPFEAETLLLWLGPAALLLGGGLVLASMARRRVDEGPAPPLTAEEAAAARARLGEDP